MKDNDIQRVLMVPAKDMLKYSRSSLWIAWLSSFFAAGSGTLLLLVFCTDLRELVYAHVNGLRSLDDDGEDESEKRGSL